MQAPIPIEKQEQFDKLAGQDLAIIFKHSTQCPTSARAHHEIEKFLATHPQIPVYVVRVVEDRPASDYIAERTGIKHESPQLIILKSGAVHWHASHDAITLQGIEAHA